MGDKNKTTFSSNNQPVSRRGKAERTKILEALKRSGKTEDDFYDHLVARALDSEDTFALREILNRFSPLKKSVLPDVEFEFDKLGSPTQQAAQILDATSSGVIPPDIALIFIQSIKSALDIEQATDLKERVDALEAMLNAQHG